MDDKNTKITADATIKAMDTTTIKADAPATDSKPAVKETTPTTTTGGGENTNMANTTTVKKVDPKFEGCQTYTVQKGDALVDIANKYNVGLNQLRYFNNVPKATFKIYEGQTIYIPKGEVKVPVGA